ncbi:MAG: peroxiredoxin [Zetaproteobacteria bacterium]|nr:MAG: peroxiredoxin [Zetaproteobacteria bacterium]
MTDYAINCGDPAPGGIPFTLYPGGETRRLEEFRGRWVILYFYPKDSTPGCTTEACDFRDRCQGGIPDTVVLGASRDSIKSHQRFSEKQQLNFPLISDPDEALCRAFDVIQEKNMYGRKTMGVERSTFIIDPEGIVRAVWRKVRVKGHVEEVMAKLAELQQG